METITRSTLDARVENLNRRIESTGRHVEVQGRNGGYSLDEYRGDACIRLIRAGTKREMAEFLHAMMVGIDLSRSEDWRIQG